MGDKLYFECAEDILPFLGKTPQECGYTSGKAERRIIKGKDVIHVTVYNQDWLFERAKRIKKRFSYNLDPYTGQYIEDSAHATVESLDNPESPPRHEQLNRLFRRFRH